MTHGWTTTLLLAGILTVGGGCSQTDRNEKDAAGVRDLAESDDGEAPDIAAPDAQSNDASLPDPGMDDGRADTTDSGGGDLAQDVHWPDIHSGHGFVAVPGVPEGLGLHAVACMDESAWAVGESGTIWKFDGTTLETRYSGTANNLNEIVFIDGNDGFAAGENGAFIKTSDGGEHWSTVGFCAIIAMGTYHAMAAPSSQAMYIVGQSSTNEGTFKYNHGSSWLCYTRKTWPGYQFRATAWLDGETGFITGHTGGVILATTNVWDWREIPTGLTAGFRDMAFASPHIGIVVGDDGAIVRSDDRGASWSPVESGTNARFHAVATRGARVLVVGESGTLLESMDAGVTFLPISSGTSVTLRGVCMGPDGRAILVGDDGSFLVEQRQAPDPRRDVLEVSFPDAIPDTPTPSDAPGAHDPGDDACCDAGLMECDGGCVDLDTDTAHCGTCGNRCAPSQECVSGHCNGIGVYSPAALWAALANKDFLLINVRVPPVGLLPHTDASISDEDPDALAAFIGGDRTREVVLYCRTNPRSLHAVAELNSRGYTNVSYLEGGVTAWTEAGYPLQ